MRQSHSGEPASSPAQCVSADAKNRGQCDRDYKPQVGQSGKDVVWVPTPDEMVQHHAAHGPRSRRRISCIDLGAGDGKIAIQAGQAEALH